MSLSLPGAREPMGVVGAGHEAARPRQDAAGALWARRVYRQASHGPVEPRDDR